MMQIIPRWKVQALFENDARNVTLWIYDSIGANVLRKAAEMQFTENGLDQPKCIIVSLDPPKALTLPIQGGMLGAGMGAP